jgi:hypothetical protein
LMKPLRRTLASLRIGVGKTVEVRGLVFAVPISPLGTPFINFRREYPNQTFAGFIASVQWPEKPYYC